MGSGARWDRSWQDGGSCPVRSVGFPLQIEACESVPNHPPIVLKGASQP